MVVLAALAAALLVGAALAASAPKGVAVLLAVGYVPLALLNLPLAVALWIPLVFVMRLGLFSVAPLASLTLLALAWFGTLRRDGSATIAALRLHGRTLVIVAAFLVWITLSAAWASDPGNATRDVWQWAAAALVLVIVATGVTTPAGIRLLAAAFATGAVLSVLAGFAGLDAQTSDSALQTASEAERGRLSGGSGDPNYLAAGIVPAVLLLSGLMRRNAPLRNAAILAAVAVLTLGLAATESRGGLVAAAVAVLAALLLFRGRRPYVIVFLALIAALAAAFFSIDPSALERVTTFDEGGNGRTELWQVAWRMTGDNPVVGVGLNNFVVEAGEYVRQPGPLEFVNLIAERPHVAHNTYLQMLAETGIIGLVLLLGLLAASLRAAWVAGEEFHRNGDREMATLARAVFVAVIAAAAASFFISNGNDWRLWILLGFGPALLGAAKSSAGARAAG